MTERSINAPSAHQNTEAFMLDAAQGERSHKVRDPTRCCCHHLPVHPAQRRQQDSKGLAQAVLSNPNLQPLNNLFPAGRGMPPSLPVFQWGIRGALASATSVVCEAAQTSDVTLRPSSFQQDMEVLVPALVSFLPVGPPRSRFCWL